MIDERMEAIVNEVLDGTASPEDQAQLSELLERDPDLRAYFQDMKHLVTAMDKVLLEDPPTAIKANVLRFVHARESQREVSPSPRVRSRERSTWLAQIWGGFQARPAMSGGLVFASGIAVGVLVLSLLARPPLLDTRDLTGTIAPAPERFERLTGRTIDFQGLHGRIETGVSPDGRAVLLDFQSPAGNPGSEAEITLGFEGRPQAFRGFYQLDPHAGLVSFDPGGIRVLHHGDNRYLLILGGEEVLPQEITVRVRVGDQTLEERLPVIQG